MILLVFFLVFTRALFLGPNLQSLFEAPLDSQIHFLYITSSSKLDLQGTNHLWDLPNTDDISFSSFSFCASISRTPHPKTSCNVLAFSTSLGEEVHALVYTNLYPGAMVDYALVRTNLFQGTNRHASMGKMLRQAKKGVSLRLRKKLMQLIRLFFTLKFIIIHAF